MCQLFALESNAPTAATFSLTGFAARGGDTAEHVDGFGVAFHEASGCRLFVDEGRASDSPLAEFLCRHPIRARRIARPHPQGHAGAGESGQLPPLSRATGGAAAGRSATTAT